MVPYVIEVFPPTDAATRHLNPRARSSHPSSSSVPGISDSMTSRSGTSTLPQAGHSTRLVSSLIAASASPSAWRKGVYERAWRLAVGQNPPEEPKRVGKANGVVLRPAWVGSRRSRECRQHRWELHLAARSAKAESFGHLDLNDLVVVYDQQYRPEPDP